MKQNRFLMCPPDYFGVEYVINPWMEGQIHSTNLPLAAKQWAALEQLLAQSSSVVTMRAVERLPDLVFTANAGLIYGNKAVVSRFRFAERQPESKHFREWFAAQGFDVIELPEDALFEGAGDALLDRSTALLWAGHGMRSNLAACEALRRVLDIEVQPLALRNPSFYHLDTCFCPLERGFLLYYPGAFDAASLDAIEQRVPPEKRIAADEEDASRFACNAVNVGTTVIANSFSDALTARLHAAGFETVTTPLTEFMRAGGAAKCLSLRLDES